MNKFAIRFTVSLFCMGILRPVFAADGPSLLESFPSPGAASQLHYSAQYGLLFLRNSGSAIRIVDTATHQQIDLHLANQQFTDMDLTPDGQYLYVADWGRVSTGYGTLINPHYVHRFNLATRQWEIKNSPVDTYKLEAVDDTRVLLLESDQWVDVNLMRWDSGPAMTTVNASSTDYYGDIEYDPSTGRMYHGNSGSSSSEIHVLRLVGDSLNYGGDTGVYGSAQSGGGTSVLSLDAQRFYFGRLQVEALDVTNNIHTFPESIYAATSNIAFGQNSYYDAKTGALLNSLGYSTTVYGLEQPGNELWTYANNTLYHYALVPEPNSCICLAMGVLLATGRSRRRKPAAAPHST
jgi:hypothetical protein